MEQTKCKAWVARDKEVVAKCQHLSYFPLVVDRAEGSLIYDADGNKFIDFLSSASSLNLGSNNPAIMEAVNNQMTKCMQYTAAYSYNAPMIEYAERLASVFPGGQKAKVCFGNCGSDANDAAIKFSRAYTGRRKIITFLNAYHGNTYGASSLTTVTTKMRSSMGPFLPDIYHFPFYGIDVSDEACERECVKDMETAFATHLSPDEVAAVIIEPIQGDGGILPAHPIFMKKLYALCKKHGILFISEEVQQAFFRAGHWFSIENYKNEGIVPDGIILGKSLGAGLTLGAFIAREDIMDTLPAPAHLFTLGGNALACAAGVAAFDQFKDEKVQQELRENGEFMLTKLNGLKEKHSDIVSFVRGFGMSFGVGIVKKGTDNEPDVDGTFKVLFRAYEYGLLIISLTGNVLRVQPPLNIPSELIAEGVDILDRAMDDYKNGRIPDSVLEYKQGW